MTYRHFTAIVLLVFVAFVAGCGGSTGPKAYPVEGVVTLKGTPVEGVTISFTPNEGTGTSSGGTTDASGKYTLRTSFGTDGAGPGTYTVTLSKSEVVLTGNKTRSMNEETGREEEYDEKIRKETLPEKYTSARNTPFKGITVETVKLNTIDFELE